MVLESFEPRPPRKLHVLLFPYPEQGHINPLLDLAIRHNVHAHPPARPFRDLPWEIDTRGKPTVRRL